MESGHLICDIEIPVLQHKIDVFSSSYWESLESLRARSQETAQYQGKTRKEARRMAFMDAIASTKTRVEDLKSSVQKQISKNSEYAAILYQQSPGWNSPQKNSYHVTIMELLIIIDACRRASTKNITAVIPYFGYARADRKTQGCEFIAAKLVANLITEAGANRVLACDLHSG
ncbi:hypothetical protein K1719_046917 [Acacia pycnantha]|nr:hypothetical protein K1719_046917 [Acacia pycnantha]